MKKFFVYFTLSLILVFGIIFRFSGIIEKASAFTYDQGRDMLVVYDLVVNHKITLIGPTTGVPGIFYGPWWYWLLAIPFIIFGGDPQAGVSFVAFFGVMAIFIGFLIGKKIGGDFWGLILASFISFSPSFINSSSQMWNPNLVPFLTLISLFLILKILEKKTRFLVFTLGLVAGFILQFQAAFGIFYLLGILVFLIFSSRRSVFYFLVGFLPSFLPQIIFDLRHEFLITKSVFNLIFHPRVFQVALPWQERILNRLELFFRAFTKTFTLENKTLGILLFFLVIISLITCEKKLIKGTYFKIFPFLTIFTILFIGFSFYPDAVWDYYLIGLPSLFLVFLPLIFSSSRIFLKKIIYPFIIFLMILNFQLNFRSASQWIGDSSVLRNQLEIIDFIYQDNKEEQFNVIVYTPPLLDYPYRYLFLWYGQKKYGFSPKPSGEPQKTLYLILEPDLAMPERRDLWLQERKNDGKPVFRKKFASGLEIEKRLR